MESELGRRLVFRDGGDPDAPIAYLHPGAEHPLLVFVHDTPAGPVLRIDALVAAHADWEQDGLAELLLSEAADWMFGRAERRRDGIVIEHCLWAGVRDEQLATTVATLADTAIRLRHDLSRMGALTTPGEAA